MDNPPIRLLSEFQNLYEKSPDHIYGVDGRAMWTGADLNASNVFVVHVPDLASQTSFTTRSAKTKKNTINRPLPSWSRYIASVALALVDEGMALTGGMFVIVGDETQGPRYEHALGMAFASVWLAHYNLDNTAKRLMDLMEKVQKSYY